MKIEDLLERLEMLHRGSAPDEWRELKHHSIDAIKDDHNLADEQRNRLYSNTLRLILDSCRG